MKKTKKYSLLVLPLVLLLSFSLTIFWLGWTQSGLQWVMAQVSPVIGESVSYTQIEGQLAGPLTVHNLQVKTETVSITLEKAQFDWSPWRLLAGHAYIDSLQAQGLQLRFTAGNDKPDNQPFRLPERLNIPLKITIEQATLNNAVIHIPATNETLRIDILQLSAVVSSRQLTLQHLLIKGPKVYVAGHANLETTMPYTGNIKLDWRWNWPFLQQQLPELQGSITATGTVQNLQVAASIHGPASITIAGRLKNVFDNPQWQADLQLSAFKPAQFLHDAPFNTDMTLAANLQLQGSFTQVSAQGRVVAQNTDYGHLTARVEATLTPEQLQLASLTIDSSTLPTHLQLQGALAFNQQLDFKLQGQWQNLVWPPDKKAAPVISQQGSFSINGNQRAIDFMLNAAIDKPEPNLHLSGNIDLQGEPYITAELSWQDLRLPEFIAPQIIASPTGQITLSGTLTDYTIDGALAVRTAQLPTATIQLAAHGDKHSLTIEQLSADWLQGHWQLQGQLNWASAFNWQARIILAGINPAVLAGDDWQGNISAQLQTSGHLGDSPDDNLGDNPDDNMDNKPRINVVLNNLGGTLNKAELTGSGSIHWRPQAHRVQFDELSLGVGANQLALSGQFGNQGSDLKWSLNAPELATLLPDASGSLIAQGHFAGTFNKPRISMTASGQKVRWQDYSLKQVQANANITLSETNPSSLQITAVDLQRPGLNIAKLELTGNGTLNDHTITLNMNTKKGGLMLALQGGYNGTTWQGTLAEAVFTPVDDAAWRLAQPAALQWGPEQARLKQACWQQTPASLCLSAQWQQGQQWQAAIDLNSLPLKALSPWLPAGLHYTGRFNGQAQISGSPQRAIHGKLTLSLKQGRISQTVSGEEITLLAFNTGQLEARLENNKLTSDLLFELPQQGKLAAHFTLDPVLNAKPNEQNIRGKLTVHTDNFALVPILVPEIGRFSGELDAQLTFGGTLAAPALNGEIAFNKGTATLPRQGLVLENLHFNLVAKGDSLSLTGGAQSGPGFVNWSLDLTRSAAGWQGTGSLTGERFQAMNSAQAWVLVSPELDLRIDGHDLYLTGTLTIPEADITPRNLSSTVQVASDQLIVSEETQADKTNWQLHAEVRTVFGDDVHFEGFGLTADIVGAVTAIEQPNEPTIGQGELRLENGQYAAYGAKLDITRGRLIYNSVPITQPALDIKAVREVGNVTVGASIRGTLQNPRLDLFSTPSMPENQILSYLVLGRPISDISNADQQRLGSAATSLGLAGGALLANSVGERLGIENITVQAANDPSSAALVLGKYLTPRLYVSYGIGLFDAVNTVHLRYQLSSKWTLEARSGQSNSADFFYTIETD